MEEKEFENYKKVHEQIEKVKKNISLCYLDYF